VLLGLRLLPELIFGRLLFGYGERPVRVMLASALIILLCAFVYARPDSLVYPGGYTEPSFLQGLYFSTITFTTLGYGDFHPAADGFSRYLAMAEAISGAFLMALFVVCLAKRFSRG
jgi:prepilin signal peptidase PulO-like enzyme (type II secretory pathway)